MDALDKSSGFYTRGSMWTKMLKCGSLILALLCQFISVEGGFGIASHRNDWNNWIILPARSRANDRSGELKSFTGFRVNQSNVVNTYLDPVRMEPYIMTLSGKYETKREQHAAGEEDDDDQLSDDLIVPLGRAIEIVKNFRATLKELFDENYSTMENEGRARLASSTRKMKKIKKKYKKFLLPLLMAYKLKFLTLIPVLIGGLILLVGTTGLAGFFFALFTAVMSLKSDSKLQIKKW